MAARSLVGYGAGMRDSRLPVPPTQARGAEKRERIYRAALARYADEGVGATKVEDVIADAGVSWATFFRYFPRKEDVLIEGAARHFRDTARPVAMAGLADRRLRVRTVTERTLAALVVPAEMPLALHTQAFLEVFANPARFAALVGDDHPQPVVELLADLLAAGQERGEVRPDVDAGAAAVTLGAGVMFPAVQTAALGADPQTTISGALDIIWLGLARR